MSRILPILLAMCIFHAAPAAAMNLDSIKARAEAGEAHAQAYLGYLYTFGAGGVVDHDDNAAFKWFHKAAEQGFAPAQYDLGILYLTGRGIPKNVELGYFWIYLAAASPDAKKRYIDKRGEVELDITQTQLIDIQKRAEVWRPAQASANSTASVQPAVPVPWMKVPQPVQATINRNTPSGGQVNKVEKTTRDGLPVFRATVFDQKNEIVYVFVAESGALVYTGK